MSWKNKVVWSEGLFLRPQHFQQHDRYIEAFVEGCRDLNVTPHVAQNTSNRQSRIDVRTTRHAGYELSQYARKLIETVFGDAKQHGILRQVKLRGLAKVELLFTLAATVVNLRRMPRLLAIHPSG